MYNNKQTLTALKKAKTSLDRIITMVEENKYCINIIQQNLSVMGLLKSVNSKLLESHLSSCFVEWVKSNDKDRLDKMIAEISMIVKTAQK